MSGPAFKVTPAVEGGYCLGRCWIGVLDAGDGAVITPLPARGSALRRLVLQLHQACVQQVAKERALAGRDDQGPHSAGGVGEVDHEARPAGVADRPDPFDFRGFGLPKEAHLNFSVVGIEPPGSGGGVAGAVQHRRLDGPGGRSDATGGRS